MTATHDRLRNARIRRQVSQGALASALGVHHTVISRYETGDIEPPLKRLRQIAKVLKVELSALI